MTKTLTQTAPQKLTPLQWTICGVAALGFAFDTYELLMLPLIVRPALAELLRAEPNSLAVNSWVGWAADHGWPVLYTRDIEPTDLPDGDPQRLTDLYGKLDLRGEVVDKGPGRLGGFSGFVLSSVHAAGSPGDGGLSRLATALVQHDVEHIMVVGLAADVCVAATARDARRLGYEVTVPLGATAFVHAHPSGDDAAIAELTNVGVDVRRDGSHGSQ